MHACKLLSIDKVQVGEQDVARSQHLSNRERIEISGFPHVYSERQVEQ